MHLAEFHFFLFSFHSSRNSIKKNVFRCINFSTFRLSGSRFPDKIAWRFPCGVTASDTPCLSKWGWFLGGWTNVSCLESCSCIFFTFASETANAETYKHFVRFELLYRGGIKFNSYAKQKFCSQFPTIVTNQQASNVCGEIIYFFPIPKEINNNACHPKCGFNVAIFHLCPLYVFVQCMHSPAFFPVLLFVVWSMYCAAPMKVQNIPANCSWQ